MRTAFWFLLFVLLAWTGVEVVTHGVDGAFGGLFAGFRAEAVQERAASERAADAFQRAYDSSTARVDRQLEQIDGEE